MHLVVSIASVLVMIVFLEGLARVAVFFQYGRHDRGFYHIFKYEPFLGTRTNDRFLISYGPKHDRLRILILGGSTADSLAEVTDTAYSQLFAKFGNGPVEVINFAQGGAISSQEVIMLARYGVRLHPDVIIVIDGPNDVVAMTKGGAPGVPYTDAYIQLAVNHPFLNGVFALGRHSQFVNILRKLNERGEEAIKQSDTKAIDSMVTEYLMNHVTMEAIARGIGAHFATVLQPYIHLRRMNSMNEEKLPAITNYAYRKNFMNTVLLRMRTEISLRQRGKTAAFVDSTTAFDTSDEDCFVDEVHLTARGKELLLRHVSDQLFAKFGRIYGWKARTEATSAP